MHVLTILHFKTISSIAVGPLASHCQENKKVLPHQVLCTIFYTEQEQHMSVQKKHSTHTFERVLPLYHYMIEFAGIFQYYITFI